MATYPIVVGANPADR